MPYPKRVFFYNGDEFRCEKLEQYHPGGLHPVMLGDILPKNGTCVSEPRKPRYRIMVKVGRGAWATVWLAWDREAGRAVAIKICSGTKKKEWSDEALILRQLQTSRGGKRHEAILELFDQFIIKGPNGFHNCLVTEIVAPLSDERFAKLCSHFHLAQLAGGFAHMHRHGIAHGDPHIGNMGISLPEARTRFAKESDLPELFEDPEVTPVMPIDADQPTGSLPPYLVCATEEFSAILDKKAGPELVRTAKIFDYGRAFWVSSRIPPSLQGCVAKDFMPPEIWVQAVALGRPETAWSQPADVWSLGVVLFHLRFGGCPVRRGSSAAGDDTLFSRTLELGGPPPSEWLETWNSQKNKQVSGKGISPSDRDKVWARYFKASTILGRADHDNATFLDLLKKMLVTDPAGRLTMDQVMNHKYFKETPKPSAPFGVEFL